MRAGEGGGGGGGLLVNCYFKIKFYENEERDTAANPVCALKTEGIS